MSSLQAEMLVEQKVANARKSTGAAYLIWFFLGMLGGHRFYLGRTGTAAIMLVLSLLGWVTFFIPWIILGIWCLIDAFLIPGMIRQHQDEARQQARLEVAALQAGHAL